MGKREPRLWHSVLSLTVLGLLLALVVKSFASLDYSWDFRFLWPYIWQSDTGRPGMILSGLAMTIGISLVSILWGCVGGLFLGLLLTAGEPIAAKSAQIWVDLLRNTPILVQLYVVYFILGGMVELSPEAAGVVTLGCFCAAYLGDLLRAEILDFDRGQKDAALSLGLSSRQIGFYVMGPQIIRRLLPALVGQFVSLVKDSSLVSVLAVNELTKAALTAVSVSFRSFETWGLVALLYYALNSSLSQLGRRWEAALRRRQRGG